MEIEIENLRNQLIEIKEKLKNNENYKENHKEYMRINNKIRYWTDEEYKKKSINKSINRYRKKKEENN